MTARGTDNLRGYLREATLPPMINGATAPKMPPPGHKSHQNHLHIRPQEWRRLESIYSFNNIAFDDLVVNCNVLFFYLIQLWPSKTSPGIDSHIPDTSLGVEDPDPVTGERLTIPCPPVFNIPPHDERRPTDILRRVLRRLEWSTSH